MVVVVIFDTGSRSTPCIVLLEHLQSGNSASDSLVLGKQAWATMCGYTYLFRNICGYLPQR